LGREVLSTNSAPPLTVESCPQQPDHGRDRGAAAGRRVANLADQHVSRNHAFPLAAGDGHGADVRRQRLADRHPVLRYRAGIVDANRQIREIMGSYRSATAVAEGHRPAHWTRAWTMPTARVSRSVSNNLSVADPAKLHERVKIVGRPASTKLLKTEVGPQPMTVEDPLEYLLRRSHPSSSSDGLAAGGRST
jgi:hypothetical protein